MSTASKDPIGDAQKKVDAKIAAEKAAADKPAADKPAADKPAAETSGFLNPFDKGVTYPVFLASIPKGNTVKNHCKGKISDDQIEWLEGDLKHYKKSKK